VDKQYAIAVILIILGLGLNQSGSDDAFSSGLGIGIVAMGTFWVLRYRNCSNGNILGINSINKRIEKKANLTFQVHKII